LKSFAELNLPESVSRALRDRNYENAMPVQAAVLDARSAGRDLLVSSQTGSGKTIAFGLALAQTLLADGATKFARRPQPAALVIVPTRELATQVREELGWLLKHTGMRMASFTGGTSVSGDLAALKQGVDLAIGTPGRLVDLVQRGRLQLGELAVVVLDEADEMLDLGFREDLETLLKAAPAERRTLLLSATLPPAIRDMARQYQRDALPVDPRAEAGAPRSAPHEDIAFVAHLIAGPDRRAAVLNVLRASDAERAIVFCTTREGVGELHRYLVGRGFTATAISGDRAQAERDRALDQVRRGEARVLVATNVAARGIHLPDVDLIVHADLPLNAESLTHRSGRTGRAGRKGTAVLLATATDRRKAERLLASANVKAVWTAPPSANQIAAASAARLLASLTGDEAAVPGDQAARVDELLAGLRAKLREAALDDGELLRRLLARELERLPAGEPLRSVAIPAMGSSGYATGPERRPVSRSEFAADSVLFRVNMGEKDKAEARWLLPLICRRGGVTNREVGAIRIGPRETLFEIAGPAARDFEAAAAETDPRAPHVRIERAQGQLSSGRSPQRPRTGRAPQLQRGEFDGAPRRAETSERSARVTRPAGSDRPARADQAGEAQAETRGESPGQTARAPAASDIAPATAVGGPAPEPTHGEAARTRPSPDGDGVAVEPGPGLDGGRAERPATGHAGSNGRPPRAKSDEAAGLAPGDGAPASRPSRGDIARTVPAPRGDTGRTDRPPRRDAGSERPARPAAGRSERPLRAAGARPDRPAGTDSAGGDRPFRAAPARTGAPAPRPYGRGPERHAPGPGPTRERSERPHRPQAAPAHAPRAYPPRPAPAHGREHRPARDDRPAPAHRRTDERLARDDRPGRSDGPSRGARPSAAARPVADDRPTPRPTRPAATPFHRPGWAEEPVARAPQGHTPAFRARGARPGEAGASPVTIERKVHPPSHARAQPPQRAKPRTK